MFPREERPCADIFPLDYSSLSPTLQNFHKNKSQDTKTTSPAAGKEP